MISKDTTGGVDIYIKIAIFELIKIWKYIQNKIIRELSLLEIYC